MQASQLGENYQRKLSSTESKMFALDAELVSLKVLLALLILYY
jgi:hypothetical protein